MKHTCYGNKRLERQSFLQVFLHASSLAVLAFKEPWMSSEVRVTSPRLLWEADFEYRLLQTTYRCDPSLLVLKFKLLLYFLSSRTKLVQNTLNRFSNGVVKSISNTELFASKFNYSNWFKKIGFLLPMSSQI